MTAEQLGEDTAARAKTGFFRWGPALVGRADGDCARLRRTLQTCPAFPGGIGGMDLDRKHSPMAIRRELLSSIIMPWLWAP